MPVYAGRIPNLLLLKYLTSVKGNDALAVPIVLFGNRNYDDALIELRDILYCVKTPTVSTPELMQFDSGKSMIEYFPPKDTAGFATFFVSTPRREPWPPASSMAIISFLITSSPH